MPAHFPQTMPNTCFYGQAHTIASMIDFTPLLTPLPDTIDPIHCLHVPCPLTHSLPHGTKLHSCHRHHQTNKRQDACQLNGYCVWLVGQRHTGIIYCQGSVIRLDCQVAEAGNDCCCKENDPASVRLITEDVLPSDAPTAPRGRSCVT